MEADSKKAKAAVQLRASYEGKLCPWLSAGGLKPAPAPLVVGGLIPTPESEAVGCQGPNCALFVQTSADDAENPTGGACALAVLPGALVQCRDVLRYGVQVVDQLLPKHKT